MTTPYRMLVQNLRRLQKLWPGSIPQDIQSIFKEMEATLKDLEGASALHEPTARLQRHFFPTMDLLRRVLATEDFLFLSRQITYHLIASSEIPDVFGAEDEILIGLTNLTVAISKILPRGASLEIKLEGVSMREGPGVAIRWSIEEIGLTDTQREQLLTRFYASHGADEETEGNFSAAREVFRKIHGQLWLEFPSQKLVFHCLLPAFDVTRLPKVSAAVTYKCDVKLTDYPRIRQRFGIRRAQGLVTQIEILIKSLVRHPVDLVISFPAQGLVTTIYEAGEGASPSVVPRISQRLSKAVFRIGKKIVAPKFQYRLATLT